jgi:hypothetical protein
MSLLAGCIGKKTTSSTPARKYTIVKQTDITDSKGAKWKIYQLELTLDAGAVFTIDLNLADGDKVDCWYATEKPASGGVVDFKVDAGNSVIYSSTAAGAAVISNSDVLNFSAATSNGTSYRLVFHDTMPAGSAQETIFTELRYPAKSNGDDAIFIPLETN